MKLYTRNNCSACRNVKTALNARGQEFEEKNIEEDSEAAYYLVSKGFRSVPVVQFADGTFLYGPELYSYAK